ncbi:SDR family NAD(P)-dependent oxidoreductase [Salinibacterium sp. dk2585]|uniref:SDR family NAD(P)-dependent oxidoreductase n=1 Tax=unclassified Salinibacterium TaxID=2632331 RepID=UPI0011C255BE|nr:MULTISPECIES: SDR family NAD(P)-dependent oxidoreductase [unclassified Salinibacterium]QEE62307.1 SDR family NAD(P)-dependent oxidoreductase [Salinibacterium sp. dk2585]TXK53658.1 SDR family NAD(P)-dependent oxidoreductase [Salinibacterium sp. dk5596]
MKSVNGKIVLVTGAAMGMGRLYALRAASEGAAALALWDISADGLAAVKAEVEASGVVAHSYVVDVASLDEIRDAAARVIAELGVPKVLINNAGVVRSAWFWEQDSERDTEFTMRINALAPMHITREFLPGMIASGEECRILNVASAAGTLSNPRMAVYAASKWAAIGWSDSLRLELEKAGHRHVRVTTFAPSYIRTGMFEGARGPVLTPLMDPDYAVRRAWKAMLAGRPMLLLPWSVNLSKVMRGVLPTRAWDVVGGRWFGVYRSMDEFKGRPPLA